MTLITTQQEQTMEHSAIYRSLCLLPFLLIAVYPLASVAQDYPGDTPVPASPAPKASNSANENSGKSLCPVKYPPFAREHEVQGDLMVEYTIDEEGNHKNINVISRKLNKTSVRNRSGHLIDVTSVFDDAVIRALSECRQPVSKYSCPILVKKQVPFRFQLSG
jgi:Gram-negative bacterial TonB protein C-terminal